MVEYNIKVIKYKDNHSVILWLFKLKFFVTLFSSPEPKADKVSL